MVVMVLFTALMIEFLWRWSLKKPINRRTSTHAAIQMSVKDENLGTRYPATDDEGSTASRNLRLVILGLSLSTLFIFIRCDRRVFLPLCPVSFFDPTNPWIRLASFRSVYRTIELLDGWTGPIIANQQLFNCLGASTAFP